MFDTGLQLKMMIYKNRITRGDIMKPKVLELSGEVWMNFFFSPSKMRKFNDNNQRLCIIHLYL
jgi:hypothetical protein